MVTRYTLNTSYVDIGTGLYTFDFHQAPLKLKGTRVGIKLLLLASNKNCSYFACGGDW
jgi:hypothetical protein